MEKVTSEKAVEISHQCGKETYYASPFFLTENCYCEEKDSKNIVYFYDPVDKKMRFLFTTHDISRGGYDIQYAFEEDLERLGEGEALIEEKCLHEVEYIYSTEKLVKAEGSEFSKFRQNVNYFKNHYSYKILYDYDLGKVKSFIERWMNTKDLSTYPEKVKEYLIADTDCCFKYITHAEFDQRNIFVEVDGELAGFAYTHPLNKNMFVGLIQKTDPKYRGLSHFIYQEKARLYPDTPYFTDGTECGTDGLEKFKDSLRPIEKKNIYLLKLKNALADEDSNTTLFPDNSELATA